MFNPFRLHSPGNNTSPEDAMLSVNNMLTSDSPVLDSEHILLNTESLDSPTSPLGELDFGNSVPTTNAEVLIGLVSAYCRHLPFP